eukprot:105604-Chlamydomonas_euryale.AAC.3
MDVAALHMHLPHAGMRLARLTTSSSLPRSPNLVSSRSSTPAEIDATAPPAKQPMLPSPADRVASLSIPASVFDATSTKPSTKSVKLTAVPPRRPRPGTSPVGM